MFDKAKIGDEFTFEKTGLKSKVIDKTATSICLLNLKSSEKGIDSLNWYDRTWFERRFK